MKQRFITYGHKTLQDIKAKHLTITIYVYKSTGQGIKEGIRYNCCLKLTQLQRSSVEMAPKVNACL